MAWGQFLKKKNKLEIIIASSAINEALKKTLMKKNWKYNLENKDIRSSRQSHQKKT